MDDNKLNYCEVSIEDCRFKVPTSSSSPTNNTKMDSSIKSRRQSIRLQDKGVPNMKETTPRKSKKRLNRGHDTRKVNKPAESGDVATNDAQNNMNPLELSDNDILKMLGDFATFIEDGGVWDPASDIFTTDEFSGTEAIQPLQSQSDENDKPTTHPVTTVTSEHDNSASMAQLISSQTSETQTLVGHKRSIYTETEPPVLYSTTCQTDSVVRRSVSTQTDFDQRSQSTQTLLKNRNSISVQTSSEDCPSTSANTNADSGRNALKRKSSSKNDEASKCQIFIKNYDLSNCSGERGVIEYKIPKKSTKHDTDSVRPKSVHHKLPKDKSSSDAPILRQDNYTSGTLQQPLSKSFDEMKIEVINVLQGPCLTFLKRENCGPYCKYNHFLPSATDVAAAIRDWSNEQVHFLYLTYVQRYKMCHQMYFDVICTAFVQKRSPENIIATIKDCERLYMESQFIVVLFALKKCGYTDDDALFEICANINRSRNAINEILKMVVTFKLVNFKRTIAFLSAEMATIDFDPYFGNEILKQAVEIETLDVILLNFCYDIVRKYSCILNTHYMKSLLLKM